MGEPIQEQNGQVLAKIWALKASLNQPIIGQVQVTTVRARYGGPLVRIHVSERFSPYPSNKSHKMFTVRFTSKGHKYLYRSLICKHAGIL